MVISPSNKLILGDWFSIKVGNRKETDILTFEENERQNILKALKQTDWRISGEQGAAKLLNLKPTTLEYRIKKLGITKTS